MMADYAPTRVRAPKAGGGFNFSRIRKQKPKRKQPPQHNLTEHERLNAFKQLVNSSQQASQSRPLILKR